MIELKSLISLPDSGVAAFVNHDDRKVFLFHSTCLVEAVARYVKGIKQGLVSSVELQKDRNKLTFELLESQDNPLALPVRIRYWRDLYVDKGYTLYRPVNGVRYRLEIEYDRNANVLVTAVNTRHTAYVIGVFRNLGLAHQWVNNTFKDRSYIIPQYANNALTKTYLEKYDTPRLGRCILHA
jgi:hypothetical protein